MGEQVWRRGLLRRSTSLVIVVSLFPLVLAGVFAGTTALFSWAMGFLDSPDDDGYLVEPGLAAIALGLASVAAFRVCKTVHRVLAGHPVAFDEKLCVECGYDLTSNISGICPECGTAIKPKQRDQLRSGALE
jgi:hypothetical protein